MGRQYTSCIVNNIYTYIFSLITMTTWRFAWSWALLSSLLSTLSLRSPLVLTLYLTEIDMTGMTTNCCLLCCLCNARVHCPAPLTDRRETAMPQSFAEAAGAKPFMFASCCLPCFCHPTGAAQPAVVSNQVHTYLLSAKLSSDLQ